MHPKNRLFLLLIVPRQQIWATSLFFLVICTTIQLYTNWRWRTHMRHHEPQSNDCLSQQVLGTGAGTQKQPWKITSFADDFPHVFSNHGDCWIAHPICKWTLSWSQKISDRLTTRQKRGTFGERSVVGYSGSVRIGSCPACFGVPHRGPEHSEGDRILLEIRQC